MSLRAPVEAPPPEPTTTPSSLTYSESGMPAGAATRLPGNEAQQPQGAIPHQLGMMFAQDGKGFAAAPGTFPKPYNIANPLQQQHHHQQQQQQAAAMLAYYNMCSMYNAAYNGSVYQQQMNMMGSQYAQQMGAHAMHQQSHQQGGQMQVLASAASRGLANSKKSGEAHSKSTEKPQKSRKTSERASKREKEGEQAKVCSNCGTRKTPFWRKNKVGGLPLCNACGLYSAKNDAPRPKELWKQNLEAQVKS